MAVYDCGKSSTVLLTYTLGGEDASSAGVIFNGTTIHISDKQFLMIPCFGQNNISQLYPWPQYYANINIVPAPLSDVTNAYAFSFLFGFICAFAFSVASARRWF